MPSPYPRAPAEGLVAAVASKLAHVNGTTDDAPPDPPTMVKNWAGVDGAGWKYEKNTGFGVKRAPLVRQLLRFALFRFETTEELPDRWRDVLRCDLD